MTFLSKLFIQIYIPLNLKIKKSILNKNITIKLLIRDYGCIEKNNLILFYEIFNEEKITYGEINKSNKSKYTELINMTNSDVLNVIKIGAISKEEAFKFYFYEETI
jgi:hypothetical protein